MLILSSSSSLFFKVITKLLICYPYTLYGVAYESLSIYYVERAFLVFIESVIVLLYHSLYILQIFVVFAFFTCFYHIKFQHMSIIRATF